MKTLGEDELDFESASALARILIQSASEAVASLCDVEASRFWRNSAQPERVASSATRPDYRFPTVSLACSIALLQAEPRLPADSLLPSVATALESAHRIPRQLEVADLASSSLSGGENQISAFTAAQYLQAVAALGESISVDERRRFNHVLAELDNCTPCPVVVDPGKPQHPFIVYHLIKAANAWEGAFGPDERWDILRQTATLQLDEAARRILANHFLTQASPDEYVALAFCGCGLVAASQEHDSIAISALAVAADSQDRSGCWALGRVVDDMTDKIEISTYEIAWSMSTAARSLLERSQSLTPDPAFRRIIGSVVLAAEYASKNLVSVQDDGGTVSGWCSDHPFGRPFVESWTSGTVLHAGMELQSLLTTYLSRRTLANFSHSAPWDEGWPAWLRWESYCEQGEVDSEARILRYLDLNIVKPIRESPFGLPNSEEGTVSLVLFGPPGTSKTTIVKGMADGLGWPLVQLSPGVFIERGLELIEAQARMVFDDLQRLERAVVLFDECDELFRERTPAGSTEQVRSITAFVTASMLPKLQDLHDMGRVVFVICTNNFHALDSAVKRRGRIDHIIGVGPPDEDSRRLIVERTLGSEVALDSPGVSRLFQGTERFTRGELVFVVKQFGAKRDGSELDESLSKRLVDGFVPSLNITEDAMAAYKTQAAESSAPHIAARS